MTLKEIANCTSMYIDKTTGKDIGHREFWKRVIDHCGGVDVVFQFVPFSIKDLKKAYSGGDIHFNSLPLAIWEQAAGWILPNGETAKNYSHPIHEFLQLNGITCYSQSDCVSLLKNVAVLALEKSIHSYNLPVLSASQIKSKDVYDYQYAIPLGKNLKSYIAVYGLTKDNKIITRWFTDYYTYGNVTRAIVRTNANGRQYFIKEKLRFFIDEMEVVC